MLSWLSDIYKFITGSINDVKNWILGIIRAIYSFIDREINALANELVGVWNELNAFIFQVLNYAVSVWNAFTLFVRVTYQETVQWISGAIATLQRYINDVVTWVSKTVAIAFTALRRYFDETIAWIQKNILDPLINSVGNIIAWLQRYGLWMYNLLSNPDALVTYIGRYLWSVWLDLLRRYSIPIGRWLLHSMIHLTGELVDVLEAIMAALI